MAYRRWRGPGRTGLVLATAAGLGGFLAASKRWELTLGPGNMGQKRAELVVDVSIFPGG